MPIFPATGAGMVLVVGVLSAGKVCVHDTKSSGWYWHSVLLCLEAKNV